MDEQTMSSSNSFATAMCDVGVPFCGYEGFRDTVASSSSLYSSPGGGDVIGSYYCADMMNDTYIDPFNGLALVIAAGVIMCFMAFGIGANDAANSWATSVGSGAYNKVSNPQSVRYIQ